MKERIWWSLPFISVALTLLGGCSPKPTPPSALCSTDVSSDCRPVATVERWLTAPHLRIIDSEPAKEGRQGARLLTVELEEGGRTERFRIKWRAQSTVHGLNHPRREVVAHALQQVFLGPGDYVFPPTQSRCFELEHYRTSVDPTAEASFPDIPCVFGTASYWLLDGIGVEQAHDRGWLEAESVFDPRRFVDDVVYRRTMADVNLLTHIAGNGDTHAGQFILVETPAGIRAYNVDFTIAFDDHRNQQLSPEQDLSELQVPALRRRSVEQLRRSRERLDGFRVVASLEVTESGLGLRSTLSSKRSFRDTDPYLPSGLGWSQCPKGAACARQLLVGLTAKELGYLHSRVNQLLWRVELGDIDLF